MSDNKSLWYLIPLITWYSIKRNGLMIMLLFVFVVWNYIYVVLQCPNKRAIGRRGNKIIEPTFIYPCLALYLWSGFSIHMHLALIVETCYSIENFVKFLVTCVFLQKFEAYDSKGSVVAGDKVKEVISVDFIFVGGAANCFGTVLYLAFSLV